MIDKAQVNVASLRGEFVSIKWPAAGIFVAACTIIGTQLLIRSSAAQEETGAYDHDPRALIAAYKHVEVASVSPANFPRTPSVDRINLRRLIIPIINGQLWWLTTISGFGPKTLIYQFARDYCGAQEFSPCAPMAGKRD